jgi:putative transposase
LISHRFRDVFQAWNIFYQSLPRIGEATFYKWKAKEGGMSVREGKRVKELEEENRRLNQMYANLSLEHEILKDIIEKTLST